MSLYVEFVNQQEEPLNQNLLQMMEQLLKLVAQKEEIKDSEVAVSFVDNETIHQLNRDYRGVDQPTDVLSFAMNENTEKEPPILQQETVDGYPHLLGDIIISIPRAIEQAKEYGHSFERELGFLAVHGFLHLLGYDHQTEEDEKQMFSRQEEILTQFQLLR